jgi:hypothetical protein
MYFALAWPTAILGCNRNVPAACTKEAESSASASASAAFIDTEGFNSAAACWANTLQCIPLMYGALSIPLDSYRLLDSANLTSTADEKIATTTPIQSATPAPTDALCALRFQVFRQRQVSGSSVPALLLSLPPGFSPPMVGLAAYSSDLACMPGSFGSLAGVETGPLPFIGLRAQPFSLNGSTSVSLDGKVNAVASNLIVHGCLKCTQGSFSADFGLTACVKCPTGFFSNTVGATACSACPRGSYQTFSNSTACESCADGFQTIFSGTAVASACYHAEVGLERVWVKGQVRKCVLATRRSVTAASLTFLLFPPPPPIRCCLSHILSLPSSSSYSRPSHHHHTLISVEVQTYFSMRAGASNLSRP